ncbi:MAG: tryptophan--tRNA ligase, partial [Candidatus Aenigmarchaeota archaeon]|nr:tryptophan--tRNA ligase [Candidatus Aenigmarchaeota archaeon]
MVFEVTPWNVKGKVNYEKLIKEFGIKTITPELLDKIKKHTRDLHIFLKRGVFFAHRDLDWILNKYENGEKFYLYTGRGPTESMHIGHLVPMMFTKW